MEYLVFNIKNEQHFKNMESSLANMAPELTSRTNILICVEDESLYVRVRNIKDSLIVGHYGEILVSYSKDFVGEVKENISGSNGDIIFVNPNHVLKFGAYKKFMYDSLSLRYGLVACQTHNKCMKVEDLYDELNKTEIELSGCEKKYNLYFVDDIFDATFMIKIENLRFWLGDNNLGIYLKRMGYQNYVDNDIPVKEVK